MHLHGISLRLKQEGDEPFCFRLFSLVQMERLGWSLDAQSEVLLKLTYRGFGRTHAEARAIDQIILKDSRPIGRLILHETAEELRVADISLLPEERNLGIGTHCLKLVAESSRAKALPLRLQTRKENRACQLYRRLSFQVHRIDELDFEMELK